LVAGLFLLALGLVLPTAAQAKTVTANVVLLDHVLVFNRLGAQNVNGMIFALERDVIFRDGFWQLRPDKRPRPLVLRVSAGDTLVVRFTNLLTPGPNPFPSKPDEANPCDGCDMNNPLKALDNQVADRHASFYVQGMQLAGGANPVFVGNGSAMGVPNYGGSATYQYFAEKEGTFLVTSMGATFGGEASGGNVGVGAFAAVVVEPEGARYYRSQVTEEEMRLAAMDLDPASSTCGDVNTTADGHPIIDYEATYPEADCAAANVIVAGADGIADTTAEGSDVQIIIQGATGLAPNAVVIGPGVDGILETAPADGDVQGTGNDLGAAVWADEDKAGKPILNMLDGDTLFHADINAIITGETGGSFPDGHYGPHNPQLPNREEAFREFVSIFHDETAAAGLLYDQLRLGGHRLGDHRQPPGRGPHVGLPGLRLRGVFSDLLCGG
jgi:hypothetical protein